MPRVTHTLAVCEVPRAVWQDIADRLRAAGYDHAFDDDNLIDMTGIALVPFAREDQKEDTDERHRAT